MSVYAVPVPMNDEPMTAEELRELLWLGYELMRTIA
jgi:hypothetical protein